MATKYLRHIPTGERYAWHALFAERSDFEEIPDDVHGAALPSSGTLTLLKIKKKAGLEPPDDSALSADASRRLP